MRLAVGSRGYSMNDAAPNDLYTQDELKYCRELDDELLRVTLLHTKRSTRLMTEDRDRALKHIDRLEKDVSYLLKQLKIANDKGGFEQEQSFMSGTK